MTHTALMEKRAAILSAPDSVRLTSQEVFDATGIAPATLRKWACERKPGTLLPAVKRAGRNFYRPSDVRRWLAIETVQAAA